MSNIEEYTKNFKFIIPDFNVATWHTEIKENFKAIDALIANFVQSQQYKGAWKQVTSYTVNDLVYISDEDSDYYGYLMRVKVNHTTTGDDFDTFLANNPTYYEVQGEMGAQIAALRAQDWAEKTDGMVIINNVPIDYSSKAYAIGGTGTETNNSKYFKEQAELACNTILQNPGFIAISADFVGDENIKTVADNIQNVNSIGDNILSILSVYNNISDINICSSNINAILDAPNQATNAQNSALSAQNSAQLAQEAALSITGFDLFDHKWEDHLLNDQNWLRADTFSWQPATTQYGTYLEAYNHLVDDLGTIGQTILYGFGNSRLGEIIYVKSSQPAVGDAVYDNTGTIIGSVRSSEATQNGWIIDGTYTRNNGDTSNDITIQSDTTSSGAVRQTETVGSYTIAYWLATDGHKICTPDQETTVQNIYNESGVAWYYILDTANQRFKLPRTKYGFVGLRDTVGKYVEAGLPNITGKLEGNAGLVDSYFSGASGALYQATTSNNRNWPQSYSGTNANQAFGFDASRSNSIYGNSTTVQPPATQMYLYFYVGQFSQTATEQTAGLNSELFNGKADIEALNNKIQEVSVLPATPDNNVLYVIPE